jgi:hypothetical protein
MEFVMEVVSDGRGNMPLEAMGKSYSTTGNREAMTQGEHTVWVLNLGIS